MSSASFRDQVLSVSSKILLFQGPDRTFSLLPAHGITFNQWISLSLLLPCSVMPYSALSKLIMILLQINTCRMESSTLSNPTNKFFSHTLQLYFLFFLLNLLKLFFNQNYTLIFLQIHLCAIFIVVIFHYL